MRVQSLTLILFALIAGFPIGRESGSTPDHNKRSKSDADINAIGHRHIGRDPNFYSPEKEKQLGKLLAQGVERSSKILNDPAATEYVERVAQKLAKNSDARMPVTVRIIDSDTSGAFTLAGGYQYVDRGLVLRLEGEGELASVLARGIAHTALRSATREATKGELTQLSSIPLVITGPSVSLNTGLPWAIPLTQLKMRRDDELDADYFGIQYLYKAGYDPKCFTRFVQRIWGAAAGTTQKVPKALSTFPPLDERLAALQSEISEIMPLRDQAIVSTAEFDAFKEHLRSQESGPELKRPILRTEPHDPQPAPKPN